MKGLIVRIYRDVTRRDCTNGGITATLERAVLVGEGVPEIFEADESSPALYLCENRAGSKFGQAVYPEPQPSNRWYMFGGNFVYSSDSRFPSRQPLPVHDRLEE
jgi:hypothetical protein